MRTWYALLSFSLSLLTVSCRDNGPPKGPLTITSFSFQYRESRDFLVPGRDFVSWNLINKAGERFDDVQVTFKLFYENGDQPEEKRYWGSWEQGEEKAIDSGKFSIEKMEKLEMKGTAIIRKSEKVNLELIVYKKDLVPKK